MEHCKNSNYLDPFQGVKLKCSSKFSLTFPMFFAIYANEFNNFYFFTLFCVCTVLFSNNSKKSCIMHLLYDKNFYFLTQTSLSQIVTQFHKISLYFVHSWYLDFHHIWWWWVLLIDSKACTLESSYQLPYRMTKTIL